MEMTTLSERKKRDSFAERAAKHFQKYPKHTSYTDSHISEGEFFALRFGLGMDCVVVFTVGDTPTNYQQALNEV